MSCRVCIRMSSVCLEIECGWMVLVVLCGVCGVWEGCDGVSVGWLSRILEVNVLRCDCG
jgi:hypothetical protein